MSLSQSVASARHPRGGGDDNAHGSVGARPYREAPLCRSVGDEQGASRYKKMMTSFGVAARFESGRQQKHIVDIDHIPAERMSEVLAEKLL